MATIDSGLMTGVTRVALARVVESMSRETAVSLSGVAEAGLDEEAVELRLRAACRFPACSTGFCVAITRNGAPDRVALAVDGDDALLHDLEQRALGLRAGPVDLVGEHDRGEDRSGVELEAALALVVDLHAGHVRRQQVGGELDARGRAVERVRQRLGEHGLARAREVLEQDVAIGDQRGQHQADHLVLAEDRLLDVRDELAERVGEPRSPAPGSRASFPHPSAPDHHQDGDRRSTGRRSRSRSTAHGRSSTPAGLEKLAETL